MVPALQICDFESWRGLGCWLDNTNIAKVSLWAQANSDDISHYFCKPVNQSIEWNKRYVKKWKYNYIIKCVIHFIQLQQYNLHLLLLHE